MAKSPIKPSPKGFVAVPNIPKMPMMQDAGVSKVSMPNMMGTSVSAVRRATMPKVPMKRFGK